MVLVIPVNVKGPVPVLMMFGRANLPAPAQTNSHTDPPSTQQLLTAGWGIASLYYKHA